MSNNVKLATTFADKVFLNNLADELLEKYPGSDVEIEFGQLLQEEEGNYIIKDNKHFEIDLCADPMYEREYDFELILEENLENDENIELKLRKKFELRGNDGCCLQNCGQALCLAQWEEEEEKEEEEKEEEEEEKKEESFVEQLNSLTLAFR